MIVLSSYKIVRMKVLSLYFLLHRNEKEEAITTSNNMDNSHRHSVEHQKPDLKEYVLYG